jgi:hypothetical protein
MNNLIGNPFKVFLKENEKTIEGILIDTDEKFDYIQRGSSVCIVPRQNVLYYETNELSQTSRVINTDTAPAAEKTMAVFVDSLKVADIKSPTDLKPEMLFEFLISQGIVQAAIKGKTLKQPHIFDDAVYILTDKPQAKEEHTEVESFSMEPNPSNSYLSPADMVARLNNAVKRKT